MSRVCVAVVILACTLLIWAGLFIIAGSAQTCDNVMGTFAPDRGDSK